MAKEKSPTKKIALMSSLTFDTVSDNLNENEKLILDIKDIELKPSIIHMRTQNYIYTQVNVLLYFK